MIVPTIVHEGGEDAGDPESTKNYRPVGTSSIYCLECLC